MLEQSLQASWIRSYRRFCYAESHRSKRFTIYILLALACLMMSWEASAADAAIAGGVIPDESIRLRILANSDSPADQWLKRKVRDAIVQQMDTWVTDQDHIEQARAAIRSNIAVIEQLVKDTLAAYGYDYDVKVELGPVDFPTKLYGNVIYPAGVYEALLISIGKAEGQNWWCVLFPPLCFVDMATGGSEPVAAYASESDVSTASAKPVSEQDKEVRFFLWDMLQNIVRWFRSLF